MVAIVSGISQKGHVAGVWVGWEQLGLTVLPCPGDQPPALRTHLLSAKGADGLMAPSCLKTLGFPLDERHLPLPL